MVNRKSMGEAFELSSEKLAFIQGSEKHLAPPERAVPSASRNGAAQNRDVQGISMPPQAAIPTKAQPEYDSAAMSDQPLGAELELRRRVRKKPASGSISNDIGDADDDWPPLMISLTTRLRPTTAEALRRASLELRLRRKKLHKQQDIIEAALQKWLHSNGFGQSS
jgi:hypothetical protein